MELFWELRQQSQIHHAEAKALDASAEAREVRNELRLVIEAADRLILLNRAMWELLGERGGLTVEDLAAKVREIDLRDGKEDGRLRREVRQCPKCQRTMQRRRTVCLYCGAREPAEDPFRAV